MDAIPDGLSVMSPAIVLMLGSLMRQESKDDCNPMYGSHPKPNPKP